MAVVAIMVAVLVGTVTAAPAQAAGGIVIYRAYYNSPGTDNGTNANLNGEYIVLKNTTRTTKYVTGWTLRDKQNHVFKFPTTKINAGQLMYLRTGKGAINWANRYWGKTWYVWNNTGDTAYLRTPAGLLVDTCSWGSTGNWKNC